MPPRRVEGRCLAGWQCPLGQPKVLTVGPPKGEPPNVTLRFLTTVVLKVRSHGGLLLGTPAHKVLRT